MGKVRVAKTRGQGPLRASLLALALQACGPDAARTVLVEADTTGRSVQAVDSAPGSRESAEVVFRGVDSLAPDQGSAEEESLREEPSEGARSGSNARRVPSRTRASRGDAGETDDRVGEAAVPEEAREFGGRPPPPVLLTGGVLLPSGTVLAAELRTPLHTATTVVGDRFAARLTQAVAAGGRVVIPVGALVEGRVSHVGNANEPGYIAFLHLKAKTVRMADGRRLRISAEVLEMTGQEVVERGLDGRRTGVRTTGPAALSRAAGDDRRAMLESILIGLAGRAIVGRTSDKEIIVPSGTTFTLELVEPLEIPVL